ncbi:MAG: hypothetical protein ACFB2Z_00405 [Maricaulaceae bacterium]
MADPTRLPEIVPDIEDWAKALFLKEAKQRGLDLSIYDIQFAETDDEYVVSAFYKNKPPSLRGSHPDHPDYDVVISRAERRVVRVSRAR